MTVSKARFTMLLVPLIAVACLAACGSRPSAPVPTETKPATVAAPPQASPPPSAPAVADNFSGTYTYSAPASGSTPAVTATWTVTPCGPGCAHVTSSTGWNVDAQLIHGTWVTVRYDQGVFYCPDGSTAPGIKADIIDPNTLQGQIQPLPGPACGQADDTGTPTSFTLTKAG